MTSSMRGFSGPPQHTVHQGQEHKHAGEESDPVDGPETPQTPRVTRVVKQFEEKAMKQWTSKDVKCWISSMEQFTCYAKQFPDYIDGAELMAITKDDLATIIPKKLWRRKLMEQIELAKEKYSEAAADQSHADEGDDSDKVSSHEEQLTPTRAPQALGVIGLSNQGNTCYMNTSIQILSQTPNITRFLKTRARAQSQRQHKSSNTHPQYAMLEAWTSLCDVLYNAPSSSKNGRCNRSWTPSGIKNALKSIDSDFGSGQQDDAARCFSFMLQALDDDINAEIAAKAKSPSVTAGVRGSSRIEVYGDQPQLGQDEQRNCVHKLLRRYNPSETVVKNTFTGVERVTYECLECGRFCHQFVPLRVLKLAVVSHEIEIRNITAALLDQTVRVPLVRVLDYCSVNALKLAVTQQLKLSMSVDAVVQLKVLLRLADGQMREVSGESKISSMLAQLQSNSGNACVLVAQSEEASPVCSNQAVSCVIFSVSMTSVPSVSSVSVQYFGQCTTQRIAQMLQARTVTGSYFVELNGHYLLTHDISGNFYGFKQKGLNELVIVSMPKTYVVSKRANTAETRLLVQTLARFPRPQAEKALQQQLLLLQTMRKTAPTHILQLIAQKTNALEALRTKYQEIGRISQTARRGIVSTLSPTSATNILLLSSLSQCLAEYQKSVLLDESTYSYFCRHCNRGRPAPCVRMTKTIVHSPLVFVFHLDRFGRDSNTAYDTMRRSSSVSAPSSFCVGQKIQATWRICTGKISQSFDHATVTRVSDDSKVIDIEFDDHYTDQIFAYEYATRVISIASDEGWTASQASYNSYSYSNKFDHAIRYNHDLSVNKTKFELYGISNHCGSTTKGGHYTATVKCLSDDKWYSISDSWVRETKQHSALENAESATILAYKLSSSNE